MYLSKSLFNSISCNNIYGLNGAYNHVSESAMEFWMSPSNLINCNSMDNTYSGAVFVGDCAGGSGYETVFRANDIHDHFYGLLYQASAHVDEQKNKGNWWWKDVYGGYAAMNKDSIAVPNEQYLIDVNGPVYSSNGFTNYPDLSELSPSFWFQPNSNTDQNCDTTSGIHHGQCLSIPYYSKAVEDLYLDILVATNDFKSSEFDEETKWTAKVKLYEKLLSQPGYLDSSQALADFYIDMAGTMIQQVASLNQNNENLLTNQETTLGIIQNYSFEIYSQSELLRNCDSLLVNKDLTKQVKDSLHEIRLNLISNISQLILFNQSAFHVLDSTIESKTDLMISANGNESATVLIEQNQQAINAVLYNTLNIQKPDSLINYSATVLNIALQCPLSGGTAVFMARSLYSWIDPDMVYDDEQTCIQNGWIVRKKDDDKSLVSAKLAIYPNPASDLVNLVYNIEADEVFQVLDEYGKILFEKTLYKNSHRDEFTTSSLANGVYFYRLISIQKFVHDTGRIGVVH